MNSTAIRSAAVFGLWAAFSTPAYAYLDPATGSIFLQALIGVFASWVMYSKLFAAKAKGFFARLTKRDEAPGNE